MSEVSPEVSANPVVRVAQDLTEISNLYDDLKAQAVANANARLMPGGLAMVVLANVCSLSEWSERIEAAEHAHLADPDRFPELIIEDDDTWEPPLQTLVFWSERWRTERGYDIRPKPTLVSEAGFIRNSLDWAWDAEPQWDKFAEQIRKARGRLENVLSAGNRDIVSEDVECIICDNRLRRRMTSTGYEDEWWCSDCHKLLTNAQFNLSASNTAIKKQAWVDKEAVS